MLIKDLRFIEKTHNTDSIYGGVSAATGVFVSANGGRASADSFAEASGFNTGTGTNTGTRTAAGRNFKLSTAVGTGTAFAVTVDGKNSRVATSVSTGVDTDVITFS